MHKLYLTGLTQLMVVLFGGALIAACVHGFKAEWRALFGKPLPGALVRTLVYLLAIILQGYNTYLRRGPVWYFPIMAIALALCATGIYHFARRSNSG